MAKQYFTSTPSISNIWNGLKHAYNGWIDPQTTYQTGTAPLPTKAGTGMIRAAKEASKLSGKTFTPFLRNAQGKRSSTLGAITANDIETSKVISGQGIKKATQPFKHDPYHPSNINRAANYYVKENKLETFVGPNGKMYVKTKDGKVRSFEAVGKEYIDNSGYGW